MNFTAKSAWNIHINTVAIITLLTLLWRRTKIDVKYLFTTPSYEISKIDVMDETQKMSPKYTQLLDKLLDKMKTPSFEISKIKVIHSVPNGMKSQTWSDY